MTNIVLSFGQDRTCHASTLSAMLGEAQSTWYREVPRRRRAAAEQARAAVAEGYRHLVTQWHPGDEIFVFGAGRGAACAQALSRLLGTIGVLDGELIDYVLSTYAVPRRARTGAEWQSVAAVAAGLSARSDIAVPVRFLGMWDATRTPGAASAVNVAEGRHALAIDGGPPLQRVDGVEEVWFRGTHRDILTDAVPLDWVLDGATRAGLRIRTEPLPHPPLPRPGTRASWSRRVPEAAAVHASVEMHVRAHPGYWRRLPAEVTWTDTDWLARSERLVHSAPRRPAETAALAAAS